MQTDRFFDSGAKNVKVRGIPHLAKNKRDVGHRSIGRDRALLLYFASRLKLSFN